MPKPCRAYAQSAPGVVTKGRDTAQNAATVPPATTISFALADLGDLWLAGEKI
jgi:hypothetical protein